MIQHSPSRYLSKENKILIWKDTCTPMFITALFTASKIRKQPKCPSVDKWMKKLWYTKCFWWLKIFFNFKKVLIHCKTKNENKFVIYIYIYIYGTGQYSVIGKNEILPFLTVYIDHEGIMLSEISQVNANTIWFYLYIGSLKRLMLIDTKNRWWLAEVGLEEWAKWVKRVKGTNLQL